MSPRNLCSENFVTPLLLQSEQNLLMVSTPKLTLTGAFAPFHSAPFLMVLIPTPLTVVLRTSVPEQVIGLYPDRGSGPATSPPTLFEPLSVVYLAAR